MLASESRYDESMLKFLNARSSFFLIFFAIIFSILLTGVRLALIFNGFDKLVVYITYPLSLIPILMVSIPIVRLIKLFIRISAKLLGLVFNTKNFKKLEKVGLSAINYSNKKLKNKKIITKEKDLFWILPIGILTISIFPLPIGFYMLSRTIVFVCSIYYAYSYFLKKNKVKPWIFGFFAVLYNPISPIYLNEKYIWVIINLITIYYFYKNK